ncbi:MAG: hypothetical protein Q7R66_14660 [Undibacterium sp.]|uniref:hypothetical protein n=1 Tax=Undibacterium sp. TaxID=1914977 RepID=UPI00271A709A|nr:hypothetical protein [Undibacterium sp.]MDO8653425.1 hypothetical protein [Undibacterium sp.]
MSHYQRIACLSGDATRSARAPSEQTKSADLLSPEPCSVTEGLAQLQPLIGH